MNKIQEVKRVEESTYLQCAQKFEKTKINTKVIENLDILNLNGSVRKQSFYKLNRIK